jgi:hypothetical protein
MGVIRGIEPTCLVAPRARPDVHRAFLDTPDPKCEQTIQARVDSNSRSGVVFCVVEAELVIPEERCSADCKGQITNTKPYVSEPVGLFEFEGVEVVGYGIVASIFEV